LGVLGKKAVFFAVTDDGPETTSAGLFRDSE
jgi:hypothetical protein